MTNGSDTLRANIASEPAYLDPALSSSVDGACLAAASFSGLYTYNAEGHPVPACATGYTVSDDGLTYTVTLKDGRKRNGSLLYTLLPVEQALAQHNQHQLYLAEMAAERHRAQQKLATQAAEPPCSPL